MEYMALGKPIVSFDLKETRVSAADAAIYAKPNDEVEFATAIARLRTIRSNADKWVTLEGPVSSRTWAGTSLPKTCSAPMAASSPR
jgi:glycosyltransferase involved in cell wall biosynthesis